MHIVQVASVAPFPKAPLLCREGWEHRALESANTNVKLHSVTLKQLSSKYFCPHLKAERAITLSLMVCTPGEVRLLGLGPGCAGEGKGWSHHGARPSSQIAQRSIWWGQCLVGCAARAMHPPEALPLRSALLVWASVFLETNCVCS